MTRLSLKQPLQPVKWFFVYSGRPFLGFARWSGRMISLESRFGKAKLDKPNPPEIIALILLLLFIGFVIVELRGCKGPAHVHPILLRAPRVLAEIAVDEGLMVSAAVAIDTAARRCQSIVLERYLP